MLSTTRRLCVGTAVAGLLGLAFIPEGNVANQLAVACLAVLCFATLMGWLQLSLSRRGDDVAIESSNLHKSRIWILLSLVIVVAAALVVQTWVRPGSTIAGGDVVVPNGTAWIANLFEAWTWGGSTLGEPSELPLELPWAVVLRSVQALGKDVGTAQMIWYTMLCAGSGLAAFGLLASLRMGPMASLAGAAVYLFNPYVITWVNTYDPYMVALFLLAAIPAALVAAGTGRISPLQSALLVTATAPLIGYAFLDPPLVGMVLGALLMTPLLVAWVDGREAAFRSVRALLLAIPMLAAASAYWAVPAGLHLASAIPTQFTDLGWTYVEARATIRNAFWLNTHWLWSFPEYFPYTRMYDLPPLSIARFVLPAIAFAALGFAAPKTLKQARFLRLSVAASTLALVVIVLSTGTNFPGNTVFIPLYNLPFGWLLREPGRFLMLVGLAYSVLVGTFVDAFVQSMATLVRLNPRSLARMAPRLATAPLAMGTSLLLGVPMYSGDFVSDSKPTLAPWAISSRPTHVQMPAYWTEMATFTDSLPTPGALLALPIDDWYEMPYSWYYGTDAFIVQSFKRHVVLPSSTTYTPASAELTTTVRLTANSILNRDWRQAESLARVMNASLILVRGDIVDPYPNHSIVSPKELAAALEVAPNFVLVHKAGPLYLFALRDLVREIEIDDNYATINTGSPDLRILHLLPMGTAIVTGKPIPGEVNLSQSPNVELWQNEGDSVVWRASAPSGSIYRIADLDTMTTISLDHAGRFTTGSSGLQVEYAPDSPGQQIAVSVKSRSAVAVGDFQGGLWGPVQNCGSVSVDRAPTLGASILSVGPGGQPALRLSAADGRACEKTPVDWHGGPILISLMVNSVQGAAPRICLWEAGRNSCAAIPSVKGQSGWSDYRASVTPDSGTTGLVLYLYADSVGAGSTTIVEYAKVRVLEVTSLPTLVVLTDPDPLVVSPLRLGLVRTSFSSHWQGPPDGEHVKVNGLTNGWLIQSKSQSFVASYDRAGLFRAAGWISLAVLVLISIVFCSIRIRWFVAQVHLRGQPKKQA